MLVVKAGLCLLQRLKESDTYAKVFYLWQISWSIHYIMEEQMKFGVRINAPNRKKAFIFVTLWLF